MEPTYQDGSDLDGPGWAAVPKQIGGLRSRSQF